MVRKTSKAGVLDFEQSGLGSCRAVRPAFSCSALWACAPKKRELPRRSSPHFVSNRTSRFERQLLEIVR